MPGLDYLSEREWAVYTIEKELHVLDRLSPAREAFSTEELKVLRQSLAQLTQLVSGLDEHAGESGLPAWLQRKSDLAPSDDSESGKSAA